MVKSDYWVQRRSGFSGIKGSNYPRRIARHDCKWRHLFPDYRASTDDRSFAYRDPRQNADVKADPDVWANMNGFSRNICRGDPRSAARHQFQFAPALISRDGDTICVHENHVPRDQTIIADGNFRITDDARSIH